MKTALVLIANGCEDMETVIIIDILRRGGIEVQVCGIQTQPKDQFISLSNGCKLVPDRMFNTNDEEEALIARLQEEEYDILVLPGGSQSALTFKDSKAVQQALKHRLETGQLIGAICAAPLALASLLPAGYAFTGYPSMKEQILKEAKNPVRFEDAQFVVSHRLITSQGPATAIPFALELVRQLEGAEAAERVSKAILWIR